MNESSTEREMLAVDSEFRNYIGQDYWRFNQLLSNAANPDHPASRFGVGSKETLDHPTTREALLSFHAKHYKPNRMNLCILGNRERAPFAILPSYNVG